MIDELLKEEGEKKNNRSRVIVKLSRSCYRDNRGIHQKLSLNYLKRKCENFNFLDEDAVMVNTSEVFDRIINLNECEDGVYEVEMVNVYKDWETNYVEDYDYKLIKYEE